MKKLFPLLTALALTLTACAAPAASTASQSAEAEGLTVVTTLFPYYDFARSVAGDRAEVTLLLAGGAESHSYEPTVQDVMTMASADLLLYNGGSSEHWLDELTDSLPAGQHRVALMNSVETLCLEHDGDGETDDCDRAHEADEHFWTSPKNAVVLVRKICEELTALDAEGAEVYAARAEQLIEQLNALDAQFTALVKDAKRDTLVFGDRFPLLYFTEAYGLDWKAAFDGCAEDTEPSAARVVELIDYVKEHQVPAVYHLELSNASICQTIAEATGCAVLEFHSCHNVTAEQLAEGVSYCELMEANLAALEVGLQ